MVQHVMVHSQHLTVHVWHGAGRTWSKMRSSQGVAGVKGPTRPKVSQMGRVRPTCQPHSGFQGIVFKASIQGCIRV